MDGFLTIMFVGGFFTLGLEYSQKKRLKEEYTLTDKVMTFLAWPAVLGGIVEFYVNED